MRVFSSCSEQGLLFTAARGFLIAVASRHGAQAPEGGGFSSCDARPLLPYGIPSSTQGDLPNLGIEPGSPALQADSFPLSHQGSRRLQYLGVQVVINLWFCGYTKISIWLPEMVKNPPAM